MAMDTIWGITQFTFNGVTYNGTNGGPLDIEYDWSDTEIEDRVADQRFPSIIIRPESSLSVSITMRDIYTGITRGTKSDLAVTFAKDDSDTTEVITFKNMKFLGESASVAKSTPGQASLRFLYEGDGATVIVRT